MLGVNGESGNSNVMLGVEWYKREAVYQIDREFFRNGVGRSDQPDRRLPERDRLTRRASVTVPPGGTVHAAPPIVYAPNRPTQAAVNALFAPYGIAPGTVRNRATTSTSSRMAGRSFA